MRLSAPRASETPLNRSLVTPSPSRWRKPLRAEMSYVGELVRSAGIPLVLAASIAGLICPSASATRADESDVSSVLYEISLKVRRDGHEQASTITGTASADGTREVVNGSVEGWRRGDIILSRPNAPRTVLRPLMREYFREPVVPRIAMEQLGIASGMIWREEGAQEALKHLDRIVRRIQLRLEYGVVDASTGITEFLPVFDADVLIDNELAPLGEALNSGVAFDPLRGLPRLPGDLARGAIIGLTINGKGRQWEALLKSIRTHEGAVDLKVPAGYKQIEK